MDPNDIEHIQDLCGGRRKSRLLEIDCVFSRDYLIGHARRIGVSGSEEDPDIDEALLSTIRNDIDLERDRLRDARLPHHYCISQTASVEDNADELARFLNLRPDLAWDIMVSTHVFED